MMLIPAFLDEVACMLSNLNEQNKQDVRPLNFLSLFVLAITGPP